MSSENRKMGCPEAAPETPTGAVIRTRKILKPGTDTDAVHVDFLGRSTDVERPSMEANDFLRRVCELAEIDFEKLASRARDQDTAGKRRLVVTLGVERWRQKGTQLAKVLNKNPDVVSWWVGEGIRRRQEDEEFAARFDMLDTELSALLTRGDQ